MRHAITLLVLIVVLAIGGLTSLATGWSAKIFWDVSPVHVEQGYVILDRTAKATPENSLVAMRYLADSLKTHARKMGLNQSFILSSTSMKTDDDPKVVYVEVSVVAWKGPGSVDPVRPPPPPHPPIEIEPLSEIDAGISQ